MVRGVTTPAVVTLFNLLSLVVSALPRDDSSDQHTVSEEDARRAIQNFGSDLGKKLPGCGKCTPDEVHYCLGDGVLKDHCCCDAHYLEPFSYVPHTCLLAPLCTPITQDCEHYARVRVCCCDHTTANKWRHRFSSSTRASSTQWLLPAVFVLKYSAETWL